MLKLEFTLKNETKTCFRFESKNDDEEFITLYLKKKHVREAGIDPTKGITVTVEERKEQHDKDK